MVEVSDRRQEPLHKSVSHVFVLSITLPARRSSSPLIDLASEAILGTRRQSLQITPAINYTRNESLCLSVL
jgi:hypothetical protein